MTFFINKYSYASNENYYFKFESLSFNQAEKQVYLETHIILINCTSR